MSLYDKTATKMAEARVSVLNDGITGTAQKGIDSAVSGASSAIFGTGLMGSIATGIASEAASNLAGKYIPKDVAKYADSASGMLDAALSGDLMALGMQAGQLALDIFKYPPKSFMDLELSLLGGITLKKALEIHQRSVTTDYSRKNLFYIEVSSHLLGDETERFNLFITDLEFSPLTISGEKKQIGAAHIDTVSSSEPIELRMTTLDNKIGDVKKWFSSHCNAASSSDGTVGVPFNYAIKIKILHAFNDNNDIAYVDKGLFRAANMDISLSKQEQGMQELSLSFNQLDTFMKV